MATKTWARLVGDLVVELVSLDAAWTPGVHVFTKDLVFADVSTVAGVGVGWVETNGTFAAPSPTRIATPVTTAAPTTAELIAHAEAKQGRVLAQVWSFDVGKTAAPLALTTRLDERGQNAMARLAAWGLLNTAALYATDAYSNVDYTPVVLTAAQAILMANLANAVVSKSRTVLNALVAGITAAKPTITAFAQVDGAAWPSP